MVTWNVVQLDRNATDGFVIKAHWEAVSLDGTYAARTYGDCPFSGDLITPFKDLTQEQVLGWVWEQVDKQKTEDFLENQIKSQKDPVVLTGVPWIKNLS